MGGGGPVAVRTSTKSFLQRAGSPGGSLPESLKRHCEHSTAMWFPPPGWIGEEKGAGEGEGRVRKGKGRVRGRGG